MKETIVLYPAPGTGHMISLVELGKLILQHHPDFSITVLVTSLPSDTEITASYINQITQTNSPISFRHLPTLDPLHHNQDSPKPQSRVAGAIDFICRNVPIVIAALHTISLTSSIPAFITFTAHTSYDPNIPTYFYYTSCASSLAAILYLPTIYSQTAKSLRDLNTTLLNTPGLPPIKASHFPQPVLDRDTEACNYFLNFAASIPNSNGVILNTFNSLEPRAIEAIGNGMCTPGNKFSPVYSIGPLVADAKDRLCMSKSATLDCLSWLDAQPRKSVAFLCFGSKGVLSVAQLKEIAKGLEKSDQRFLWVVKSPVPDDKDELNLDVLLPEGFLERTEKKGLVVKSWAPQAAVLRHESVGGFVTHCGWNSVLEAVAAGVPMLAWPLSAEQHLNSVVLEEEMKLAIAMDLSLSSEDGLVSAEEVEIKVGKLMRSLEGEALKQRSLEMKGMALAAWEFGGSSVVDFSKLVGSWKKK